jgi:hypothetical protein
MGIRSSTARGKDLPSPSMGCTQVSVLSGGKSGETCHFLSRGSKGMLIVCLEEIVMKIILLQRFWEGLEFLFSFKSILGIMCSYISEFFLNTPPSSFLGVRGRFQGV